MKKSVLCAQVALFLGLGSAAAFSQVSFKAVKVPGASPNTPIAINNKGEVMVNTSTTSSYQLSTWSRLNGTRSISIVGTNNGGIAINNSSDIVGSGSPDSSPATDAYLWSGSTQWLPSLGGDLSAAKGINDSGTIVGFSYTAATQQHAFEWSLSGGLIDLTPSLTSIGGATATSINASGQVAGYYYPNGSNRPLGFLWTNADGLQNIGVPGTLAYAINTSGTVVGQSPNASGLKHAFSWTSTGGIQDLGTLGGTSSSALGINKLGWIVGSSLTSSTTGLPHGFLWTATSGMRDLATIGGLGANQVPYSMQINDFGVIAVSSNGGGYVLVPIMNSTVSSSANPSVVGQAVTFTATVNSIAGPPPDGEPIQFVVSGVVAGTVPLQAGVARFTTSSIAVGTHAVVAKYNGDANYLPAKYTATTQVVNP
jgi:probable HAF family extracellular repeat protein